MTRETVGTAEAAEILGVSPRTVLRWAKAGQLRHIMLPSGRRRYAVDTLTTLIAEDLPPRNGDVA